MPEKLKTLNSTDLVNFVNHVVIILCLAIKLKYMVRPLIDKSVYQDSSNLPTKNQEPTNGSKPRPQV